MKRIAPLVAVALALAAMALIRVERGTPRRRPPERSERETGGPEDWMLSQRVIPNGIPAGALERAAVQARKVRATTSRTDPSLAQASWKPLGPSNIGGRIVDAVVDPAHADTLYVAAATGGVWKSTDKGSTFSPVWPAANVQAMGALAITPDGGTLYAGTGEANPGGGSITYGGQGVYRSTNGGANWQNVGLAGTGAIGRIAIDPKNPQRIMVAAAGRLYDPGGRRGVYRSTNGGATWSRVLAGANDTTGAVDVAIDPNDPQRVYAAMWDHVRHPDLRVYGGVGSGVFRSVDGGATWHRLSNGLPGPSPAIGRIGIALSPSNPMRLYAIVIRTLGPFEGFYTSADGGDSWTKLADDGTLSGAQSSYGWWFGRVWVDPVDARHVFVAGVYLCESNNGGTSFLGQVAGHADDHAMAWDPNVARRVYLGNDGGVWRSEVNGSNDEWSFGTDEPFTQFYSVDVSEQNARRVVGGAQDNNALRTWGGPRWNAYVGGDGEETLINPTNQQNVFGCSQYGVCSRSVDGGDTMIFMGSAASDRWNWFSPLQFAPSDPSVLYLGGNKLNRSTNGGVTFKLISPDLTGGPGPDPNYPFGTHHHGRLGEDEPERDARRDGRRPALVLDRFGGTLDQGHGSGRAGHVGDPGGRRPHGCERRLRHVLGVPGRRSDPLCAPDRRRGLILVEHHEQSPPGACERHRDQRVGSIRGHGRGRVPLEKHRRHMAGGWNRPPERPGHRPGAPGGVEHPVRRELRPGHVEPEPRLIAPGGRQANSNVGLTTHFVPFD
jgi:hypothetical protein